MILHEATHVHFDVFGRIAAAVMLVPAIAATLSTSIRWPACTVLLSKGNCGEGQTSDSAGVNFALSELTVRITAQIGF